MKGGDAGSTDGFHGQIIHNRYGGTDMKKTTVYRSIEEVPLVLTIDDLMAVLNIGRNSAYDLVRSGRIKSFRVGTQIRIPRQAVADFLANTAA